MVFLAYSWALLISSTRLSMDFNPPFLYAFNTSFSSSLNLYFFVIFTSSFYIFSSGFAAWYTCLKEYISVRFNIWHKKNILFDQYFKYLLPGVFILIGMYIIIKYQPFF